MGIYLPYILILVTHRCEKQHRESFKRRGSSQYVLYCCDYAKQVVASFSKKLNLNTMLLIDLYILKLLNYITQVLLKSLSSCMNQVIFHSILGFTNFVLLQKTRC